MLLFYKLTFCICHKPWVKKVHNILIPMHTDHDILFVFFKNRKEKKECTQINLDMLIMRYTIGNK
jgi:hypothetical protein